MDNRQATQQIETQQVELTPDELVLVRTALELLRSMLGREEADELAQVQRLIAKIDART